MKSATLRILALIVLAAPSLLAAQPDLAGTRNALEQWIELRKTISEEENQWKADRQILRGTIDLLKAQIAHVDETITNVSASTVAATAQRDQLANENKTLAQTTAVISDALGGFETTLVGLAEYFPPDLRAKVDPLLARIPKPGEPTRVGSGERLQIIVGILGEAEKFDRAITVSREFQKLASGETAQVETLYLGLAVAFYVDGSGSHAGVLRPAKGAWVASPDPALAASIRRVIAVYRNDTAATFVPLPVEIK